MIVQVEELVSRVRTVLDRNATATALWVEGDTDTLSTDALIRRHVPEAARRVEEAAPPHLLETGHTFADSVYWRGDGSGWVLLPADFMRLVVFEMSDWERAVCQAITPADPRYALQRSRYAGCCGGIKLRTDIN